MAMQFTSFMFVEMMFLLVQHFEPVMFDLDGSSIVFIYRGTTIGELAWSTISFTFSSP